MNSEPGWGQAVNRESGRGQAVNRARPNPRLLCAQDRRVSHRSANRCRQAIVAERKKALLARERAPIVKYGRFLKPILARVAASSTAAETAILQQNMSFVYATATLLPAGYNR